MAIYGAIPVIYAHSPKNTVGIFWHNAAETWVDINNSKDANVVSSLVNLVSGSKSESSVSAHFMSESGIMDLFVLMGPTPKDTLRQYSSLTGKSSYVFDYYFLRLGCASKRIARRFSLLCTYMWLSM